MRRELKLSCKTTNAGKARGSHMFGNNASLPRRNNAPSTVLNIKTCMMGGNELHEQKGLMLLWEGLNNGFNSQTRLGLTATPIISGAIVSDSKSCIITKLTNLWNASGFDKYMLTTEHMAPLKKTSGQPPCFDGFQVS